MSGIDLLKQLFLFFFSPRGFAATLSPSPRKKPALSTVPPKAPAYQRFRQLLEETPAVAPSVAKSSSPAKLTQPLSDARLELPVAYKSLLESFRALDVIYFMLFNRKDLPIYFDKVETKGKKEQLMRNCVWTWRSKLQNTSSELWGEVVIHELILILKSRFSF